MARLRNQFDSEQDNILPTMGGGDSASQVQPDLPSMDDGLASTDGGEPTSSGVGRSGETPRERYIGSGGDTGNAGGGSPDVHLRGLGGDSGGDGTAQAAPRRPSSPTPMAGSTFTPSSGGSGGGGVVPFSPMASPNIGSLTAPVGGGLYGSAGGLTGGGLGVPLDPISNQQSNPLDMLLKIIKSNGGR